MLICLLSSRYPWNCSKCEFDACNDCLKPFNVQFHHHPLQITDSRVSYPQYGGRWKCDHCQCVVDQYMPGKDKSFHCAICKYDVCFSCMQRRTGWPSLGKLLCFNYLFCTLIYRDSCYLKPDFEKLYSSHF